MELPGNNPGSSLLSSTIMLAGCILAKYCITILYYAIKIKYLYLD